MLTRRYRQNAVEKHGVEHTGNSSRSVPSRFNVSDKLGNRGFKSLLKSLQANATVTHAHDSREREADHIADTFVSSNTGSTVHQGGRPALPRNSRPGKTLVSETSTMQPFSSGQPLPATIRENMESHVGHDLSAVRVYDDNQAHFAARGFGAQAFTMGNNIAFARGRYQPDSLQGQKLLAHELAHVVQQRTESFSSAEKIQLKRDPDVVFKGHYSFYLTQGRENEFAVQFYYSGTGTTATIKVAHQPSGTMRQGTINLPEGATFNPVATVDGETTTLFDLDGDGSEEVAVQAVVDDYRREYLTADSSPMNPTYQWYNMRDIYVVASWGAGGSFSFRINDAPPANAVTAPNWVMRSHPHPNIGMVWYDTQSSRYVIPPMGGHSPRSDGYDGPPPFLVRQQH